MVVGFVGRLDKDHGVRRLADAARVPGTRLVVVGEGPQEDWLRRNLEKAKFPGALRGQELATAVASFDLLVHPGAGQTDGHTLMEAAASGIPVVAPATGGTLDVVRDGHTGLLYDAEDPRGLRRAIAALCGDADHRAALGRQGRHDVAGRGWDDAVGELVDRHYAQALASARVPVSL